MKPKDIQDLVQNYSLEQLTQAETDLLAEQPLRIEVHGADENEKLTHVLAATWILEKIKQENLDIATAMRLYFQRVRATLQ